MHGRFEYLMPKLMHGHNLVCNLDQNGREEAKTYIDFFFNFKTQKIHLFKSVLDSKQINPKIYLRIK